MTKHTQNTYLMTPETPYKMGGRVGYDHQAFTSMHDQVSSFFGSEDSVVSSVADSLVPSVLDSLAPSVVDSLVLSVVDGLDFGQEFKLLPFVLTNKPLRPPPYEIRETFRRFVLYLEPSPNSWFYRSIEVFQNKVFDKYGPNQAQQYPPHCSLTGMMTIKRVRGPNAKWYFVDKLVSFLDRNIAELKDEMYSPALRGLYTGRRPSPSLVVGLALDAAYGELVRRMRARFHGKFTIEYRTMDRLNLAYNTLNPMPSPLLRQLHRLAEETIAVEELLEDQLEWDLVLHEVMIDSSTIAVKHQFAEMKRWRVVEKGTGWGPHNQLRMGARVFIHRLRNLTVKREKGEEENAQKIPKDNNISTVSTAPNC
ncbi:hypothetical protein BC938DRAFT_481215 [Jimgerdemannia flammicorona]|uniref:Uncharacterized protein n=1 Tax=Jimgerdemannia flammicorona TaxID=994334 RepID=A0A433QGN9_9FUNG|nr:hypothetical protein BC938DRAFT_481215 [Jimgerdemannia flammicorona]